MLKSLVAAVFALGCIAATAARAQEVTLRVHHAQSMFDAGPMGFIGPWAEKVRSQSGGRIRVEIHGGMKLGGKPADLYDQAKDGVVDIVWTLPGLTPGRFPKSEVFDLPLIASNAEITGKALWPFFEQHLADEYGDVKILAVHVHGYGAIHTKDRPIPTLADFEGKRIAAPTRSAVRMLEAFGATAVPLAPAEMPEALTKGAVDGVALPWAAARSLKIHELTKAHTEMPAGRSLFTTLFVLVMNKARYDALPADLKAVIDANAGAAASLDAGKAMDAYDIPGRAVADVRGNTFLTLPPAEVDRWRAAAEPVVEAWIADMKARGVDGRLLHETAQRMIWRAAGL